MTAPATGTTAVDAAPVTVTESSSLQRRLGIVGLGVVFAIVCGLLAWWQLDRREARVDEIAVVSANWDAAPVPIATLLPSTAAAWPAEHEWASVEVTGTYLVDEQVLVRNRPYQGAPGFEILTPLATDAGIFIVDRGWIPTGNEQDHPDAVPAPPTGEVTVVARLKPTEPVLAGRTAPAGQIATIQLGELDDAIDGDVYQGAYGLLVSEQPSTAHGALAARPSDDEGPHLSYAFQWAGFGLFGLGWSIWTAIHEGRLPRTPAAPSGSPASAGPGPRRPGGIRRSSAARTGHDEDEEDRLLERSR